MHAWLSLSHCAWLELCGRQTTSDLVSTELQLPRHVQALPIWPVVNSCFPSAEASSTSRDSRETVTINLSASDSSDPRELKDQLQAQLHRAVTSCPEHRVGRPDVRCNTAAAKPCS